MNILITQCVQKDFVRPLAPGEPLPNLVHVGRLEADRLCGRAGALVDFLNAAHAVDPARLAILHVVDRHDPVAHAAHLAQFRPHCLAGSDGARLIDPIDELVRQRPNTALIPAGDLNDFEEGALREALARVAGGAAGVRIGVVGVWTDAKIAFLLYDLRTRLRATALGTCSALTASRSLGAHFRGLESLRNLLDVDVFHSPGAFLDWLVPERAALPVAPGKTRLRFTKAVAIPSWWTAEHVAERDALLTRFSDGDATLDLLPLGGGFSGAQVFMARTEAGAAAIMKVGARDEVARERFGNESIGRVLGDVVPRLREWREGRTLAAMEMELAQSDEPGTGAPTTFQTLYQKDDSDAATLFLDAALEELLDRALGRLYRWGEKDNADLLETYGFTDRRSQPQFVESVVGKAEAVARENGFASARALLDDAGLQPGWLEPAAFYREWLPGRTLTREVYPSAVHGDLNLQNVMLSRRDGELRPARLWIIDFARLTRLPCLTDFAKIENDLAFILLSVVTPEALARARRIQEARLRSATPAVDLMPLAETPEEKRHARLVTTLRRVASRIDPRGETAMADYRVALLRYAAHTLGFDEPNALQRRLALEACARLAGEIVRDSAL